MVLTEAAIIAVAKAVEATANMITVIVEGQPPEIRERAWQRWNDDQERWRKLFGLE